MTHPRKPLGCAGSALGRPLLPARTFIPDRNLISSSGVSALPRGGESGPSRGHCADAMAAHPCWQPWRPLRLRHRA
eukprot:9577381-Alexandrium_andersonii.AAC.1